jgi:hypothetical protein
MIFKSQLNYLFIIHGARQMKTFQKLINLIAFHCETKFLMSLTGAAKLLDISLATLSHDAKPSR